MKFFSLLVLLSSLLLAGCAGNPMVPAKSQEIAVVKGNQSQVVFMRSSFLGAAISASLYDVTDGEPIFIGVINNGTKVSYSVAPGKHVFMVVSEAADFLEADLKAGKTYYSLATPRMGAWAARFSLWPIKNDSSAEFSMKSSDFSSWVSGTTLVENGEKSQEWFAKNKASIKSKYAKYWPVWQEKSAEDIAKRTLQAKDGV